MPQAWHISFVQIELSRLRGGWIEASKLRCEIDKISGIDRHLLQIYDVYDIIFLVQILKISKAVIFFKYNKYIILILLYIEVRESR